MSDDRAVRRNPAIPDPSRRLCLTDRDRDIALSVFLAGAITREQLQRLGFFQSTQVAVARMRKLWDGGLLKRHFAVSPKGTSLVGVYTLGPEAVPIVASALNVDPGYIRRFIGRGRVAFLAHALALTEVQIALTRKDLGSGEWLYEFEVRHAYAAQNRKFLLKPDAALLMKRVEGDHVGFIELDCGNVSNAQWASSMRTYRDYFDRELPAKMYGASSWELLVVTTGGRRRIEGMARAAQSVGVTARFAEYRTLLADPLGPVWWGTDGNLFSLVAEVVP